MSKRTPMIMAVPTKLIPENMLATKFHACDFDGAKKVIQEGVYRFRGVLEQDPAYKQIIPYTVVVNTKGEILTYKRSSAGGENRLHNRYSIGVGGHIDQGFIRKNPPVLDYFSSALRELYEELHLEVLTSDLSHKGTIYDGTNEVGQVHLGIVSVITVPDDLDLTRGETDILVEREFLSPKTLGDKVFLLENWSKIVYENLDTILGE